MAGFGNKVNKCFCTNDWATRVNFGILAMLFIDAFLLYKLCHDKKCKLNSCQYFLLLADELINIDIGKGTKNTRSKKQKATNEIVQLNTCAIQAPTKKR